MSQRSRPEVIQFRCGQHFVHRMQGRAGDVIDLHRHHAYAHEMYVERGRILVTVNDLVRAITGPDVFNVPSGVLHGIEWLDDAVVSCWHVCRFANGAEFPFDFEASEHQFDEAVAGV